jgi:hypothetical protein
LRERDRGLKRKRKRKRESPQRENFLAGFGCKKINGQENSHPLFLLKT